MSTNFAEPATAVPDAVVDIAASDSDSLAADNAADESATLAASDETQGATTDNLSDTPEQPEVKVESEDEPVTLDDPLAEFEDKPLTREQIDSLGPRWPKEARALLERSELERAKYQEQKAALGGEQGLSFAKAVVPQFYNANPSDKEAETVFDAMVDMNPVMVAEMSKHFLEMALSHEETGPAMADKLLKDEYGEQYSKEMIDKLVSWHQSGLMNEKAYEEAHKSLSGQVSPAEAKKDARIKELEDRLSKVDERVSSGETEQVQRLQTQAREIVSQKVMERIPAAAAKIGWVVNDSDKPEIKAAKLKWGEVITAYLNSKVQSGSHYKNADELIKNNRALSPDGKPLRLFDINAGELGNAGLAEFLATARALQPWIKATSQSRTTPKNGSKPSEATAENGNRAAPLINPPSSTGFNFDDPKYKFDPSAAEQEWQKVRAAQADAQTSVGRR